MSRFVAILIYALFKESYATTIAVVGKLYVLHALGTGYLFPIQTDLKQKPSNLGGEIKFSPCPTSPNIFVHPHT